MVWEDNRHYAARVWTSRRPRGAWRGAVHDVDRETLSSERRPGMKICVSPDDGVMGRPVKLSAQKIEFPEEKCLMISFMFLYKYNSPSPARYFIRPGSWPTILLLLCTQSSLTHFLNIFT